MTYEEYEKRVIGLLLEPYDETKRKVMSDRLESLLKDDPDFIRVLYADTCFMYDRPDLYGNCDDIFDDSHLESIPVNTLDMLIGGGFD
ncbi:MAG: hypothetical protein IKS50_02065 [Methanobrevibacter sp.]|nr:hypothetical protein [Methanobrevibacter sp.]